MRFQKKFGETTTYHWSDHSLFPSSRLVEIYYCRYSDFFFFFFPKNLIFRVESFHGQIIFKEDVFYVYITVSLLEEGLIC
jgi:hypothetical protein